MCPKTFVCLRKDEVRCYLANSGWNRFCVKQEFPWGADSDADDYYNDDANDYYNDDDDDGEKSNWYQPLNSVGEPE